MKVDPDKLVQKFPFDRVFASCAGNIRDDERHSAAQVGLRRKIQMAEKAHAEELARVREEAFQAGLAQARNEREEALLSAIDALYAGFEASDEEQQTFRDDLVRDAAELAFSAAETLAGHALEQMPGQAIDDAIGRVMRQITRGQEVRIKVHPDLAEDIEKRIEERQSQDRRKLHLRVIADSSVPPGDAEFLWDRGGMSLDTETRREAIRAELKALISRTDQA